MPYRKKKHKRKKSSKLFLSFLGIIALALGLAYFLNLQTTKQYSDSSLDGSEIAEETQTTIPPDVWQNIQKQRQVLGVATNHNASISVKVPILMYHYVEYVQDAGDKTRISLNTTPDTLDSEIKTLSDAGYTFLTARELTAIINGKIKLPVKPVVLTFDDGYRDFYTDAYPILKKYHAKATQYVISGFLGLANHLTVEQLKEIAKDGLVEIGAHTVHHVWLKGQSAENVAYETEQSRKQLEDLIQMPVVSFAYPFGAFDQQALDLVQKAGYSSAVSTIPGVEGSKENEFFLYRLRPGGRTGEDLLAWLDTQE
ncbi:MAG TPA: polysaccharide deacetylase family protein [Candidatus Saccharimonadales bacterium]|nr:polysaccharide deacetylase family protein [Candidatus Saccharimonadales bacterium]